MTPSRDVPARSRATPSNATLTAHAESWGALGRVDPLWAVLTEPAKRGRRWSLPDFLATGQVEVAGLLAIADRLGRPKERQSALDFGCGVGRLTVPLAERFETVTGVDISASMIERARVVAADRPNARFELLAPDGRLPFPDSTFDLVLSLYVLQHLPARAFVVASLAELARVVRPQGLLVVQLPAPIPLRYRLQLRRRAYAVGRRFGLSERVLFDRFGLSPMRLIGVRQADARGSLTQAGLEVLEVHADVLSRSRMDSYTYFATRR